MAVENLQSAIIFIFQIPECLTPLPIKTSNQINHYNKQIFYKVEKLINCLGTISGGLITLPDGSEYLCSNYATAKCEAYMQLSILEDGTAWIHRIIRM